MKKNWSETFTSQSNRFDLTKGSEVTEMDPVPLMLSVSGVYLIVVFTILGILGARAQRDAIHIPKFVKAVTISIPVGIVMGIINLVILVLFDV